ncbi:uncharacterized protein LY89DRAFT_726835 [Mollisia scopiformis]|uniref:Uncharacterized protein n=1 Tax=Mollisia scopiformis TaxID=149040 RepID=A0A194XTX7_MOLSC|nr:uncharacterized protein LY89DRAFT_726835 [Mollisia scopiformis]KUJ23775.1 hypothetical protein LY89DRAFT_726835 [Mollisia scopiformis]
MAGMPTICIALVVERPNSRDMMPLAIPRLRVGSPYPQPRSNLITPSGFSSLSSIILGNSFRDLFAFSTRNIVLEPILPTSILSYDPVAYGGKGKSTKHKPQVSNNPPGKPPTAPTLEARPSRAGGFFPCQFCRLVKKLCSSSRNGEVPCELCRIQGRSGLRCLGQREDILLTEVEGGTTNDDGDRADDGEANGVAPGDNGEDLTATFEEIDLATEETTQPAQQNEEAEQVTAQDAADPLTNEAARDAQTVASDEHIEGTNEVIDAAHPDQPVEEQETNARRRRRRPKRSGRASAAQPTPSTPLGPCAMCVRESKDGAACAFISIGGSPPCDPCDRRGYSV